MNNGPRLRGRSAPPSHSYRTPMSSRRRTSGVLSSARGLSTGMLVEDSTVYASDEDLETLNQVFQPVYETMIGEIAALI